MFLLDHIYPQTSTCVSFPCWMYKKTACLLKNNCHKIVFNWPFASKK